METKKITISMGLSLPLMIVSSYVAYKVGMIKGRLDTYKEIVEENKDSEKK